MPSPNVAADITQQPAWPRLLDWVNADGAVAPMIITGGIEPASIIAPLKIAALCPKQHATRTPKDCTNCRLLAGNNHPDLIIVGENKATITIKQVRLMRQRLTLTPLSKHQLVVIPEAEKLSPPAVNALLKSLEEPRPTTRYALITAWPRRLPATIRSRAQIIRFTSTTTPQPTPGVGIWSKRLLERLRDKRESLTDEELAGIAGFLAEQLRTAGATPEIRRAYQRLRDYHVIQKSRGNTKTAADVVLASLPASQANQ